MQQQRPKIMAEVLPGLYIGNLQAAVRILSAEDHMGITHLLSLFSTRILSSFCTPQPYNCTGDGIDDPGSGHSAVAFSENHDSTCGADPYLNLGYGNDINTARKDANYPIPAANASYGDAGQDGDHTCNSAFSKNSGCNYVLNGACERIDNMCDAALSSASNSLNDVLEETDSVIIGELSVNPGYPDADKDAGRNDNRVRYVAPSVNVFHPKDAGKHALKPSVHPHDADYSDDAEGSGNSICYVPPSVKGICVRDAWKDSEKVCNAVSSANTSFDVRALMPSSAHLLPIRARFEVVKKGFPLLRLVMPLQDSPEENVLQILEHPLCFDFIDKGRRCGGVLVHCLAGISRSGAVVTAYMMKTLQLPFEEALQALNSVYQRACPNLGFIQQLKYFEKEVLKLKRDEIGKEEERQKQHFEENQNLQNIQ